MSPPNSKHESAYSQKIDKRETGTWGSGIRNEEALVLFGELVSDWAHVEEAMIDVLNLLIFPNFDIQFEAEKLARGFSLGQQIFRSIGNNGVRAKVMGNLLNHYAGNDLKKLDPVYERIISEFRSLVSLRNDFLHGLWWTKSDGEIYLQTENIESTHWNRKRRIPKSDIKSFIARANKLGRDIEAAKLKGYRQSDERKKEVMRLAAFRKKRS